jgi:hypothetical protein
MTETANAAPIQAKEVAANENDHLFSQKLEQIQRVLPLSTAAERTRFLIDRKGDTAAAIAKLGNYLEWRRQYCDDNMKHLDSWAYATHLAIRAGKHGKTKHNMSVMSSTLKLPCITFQHVQSTSNNENGDDNITETKYLHHLPARIDPKLADTSVYALALAIYLDHVLDRHSTEKVTLVIDVRPNHGWANIKAHKLLPFIQSTVRNLCDLYPTRLNRCIIYPVPSVAKALWKAVKPFVGKDTVKKVCLVTGPAGKNDKIPKNLSEHLDHYLISKFEQRRNEGRLSVGHLRTTAINSLQGCSEPLPSGLAFMQSHKSSPTLAFLGRVVGYICFLAIFYSSSSWFLASYCAITACMLASFLL